MKLLIMPGDGIGPEICDGVRAVLEAVERRHGLGLSLHLADVGLAALSKHGTTLPDDVMQAARDCDGLVLGPLSTYEYPPADQGGINASAAFRKSLDLFANIRPARARAGVPALAPGMDLVIVRENTEGFYADRTMVQGSGEFMPTEDLALAVRKISRAGSTRIAREACEIARERSGRLIAVHKANVLKLTDGLFFEAVRDVAAAYSDIELSEMLVDAAASMLVRVPGSFDVIVTTNMFGDILSNLAAELAGGLGLAASLNAGDGHAMAQAAHGSAPDIAGQGIANPTSLILSAAMLLDWLGRRHDAPACCQAAAAIDTAVAAQLAAPDGRTRDLGGPLGTQEFAAAVAEQLSAG